MTDEPKQVELTRRALLGTFGASLVAPLSACGQSSGESTSRGASDPSGAGTSGAGTSGGWATGGTKSMSGSYTDPFTQGLGTLCTLTCAATLGPCYAATLTRKDISEGHDGLPTRLAFLIVDESCQPIEGATVDIWHCAAEGLYSGSDASDFCTSGDATARAARWFRGVQSTDAQGRVDFDTCFPGWYSSRTIHIHFTIRVDETESVTSQLVFDDALCDEIVGNEPLYSTRGPRDTNNSNDTVFAPDAVEGYVFQSAQMEDGAMLAWKTIVLRSSSAELCQVPGGSGGPSAGDGFPGEPPSGGPPPGSPPGT